MSVVDMRAVLRKLYITRLSSYGSTCYPETTRRC